MKAMTIEQFNKKETLYVKEACWVAGEFKDVGDTVEVSGNDKVQLLATDKGTREKVNKPKPPKPVKADEPVEPKNPNEQGK